ncbi:MAG TPA: prolyl oligopeptidase family serine peptidase [Candidatus Dormibacteraeota bacterium]|nr:prolyl oligopeptidase family serine peptidase [Candidatus Dormibacteraeota bacterium]
MTVPRPVTRCSDVVDTLHGTDVPDPYRWLEDAADPEVRAWVESQGAYSRSILDAIPERAALEARIREAMDVGSLGGAVPRGRYRFTVDRAAGMVQPALSVSVAGGPPRLLVDPGPMSADGTTALDWWMPSPDGELVCVGLSEAGTEDSVLRLVRTASGEWLDDRIPRCRWSAVAFEPGNLAILYTRLPEPGTVPPGEEVFHRHVWRHVLGTDPAGDVRVFGQGRDKLDVPSIISLSDDGRWTVITVSQGWDRTSVFLRDGGGEFRPIFEGVAEKLHAWFARDRLLAITNAGAPNFRLVEIDPSHPDPEAWLEVVAESEHVLLDVEVTATSLAVHQLVDACSRVSLHRRDGTFERTLDLPPLSTATGLGGHPSSGDLLATVESFTRPAARWSLEGGHLERLEPPAGFEPARYPVRQVRCRSADGTEVPIFLVGRAEAAGPTVLTGYGGFSVSRTPLWMPAAVPFLEAGGLVAVACLRGGGEYGEAWHRAGKRGRKQNVFDDFIAAAEWLVESGLATPARLGIMGGSNGGLLVGAAMTQRPDLFGAVVCRVPLLDMVRYERFKVAELWAAEYGSASEPEEFGWLYAYSPYHRVRDGVSYPATLLTTGEEDARVDPMHARKMTARLQAADPSALVLLRVEPRAGHGQGKPTTKLVPEEADVWSFLMDRLGPRSCAG